MANSYSKLRDGSWGVRIESRRTVKSGDRVMVTRKDGARHAEVIDKVVWSDASDGVWLCSVRPQDAQPAMAVQATPPVRSADVKIKREDDDVFRVTSPTGAIVNVSLDAVKNRSQVLHRLLSRYMVGQLTTQTLTYPQMADLAACRIGAAPKPVAPPVADDEPEPYDGGDGDGDDDRGDMKAAFAAQERKQEAAAFMSDPDVQAHANGSGADGEAKAATEGTVKTTAVAKVRRTVAAGADAAEQRINQLAKAASDMSTEQLWAFDYDIASEPATDAACPNPSHLLRRLGVRGNGSTWWLPQRSLSVPAFQQLLAHWKAWPPVYKADGSLARGVCVRLFRWHPDEMRAMREVIREKLRQEVVRVNQSMVERIITASDKLQGLLAEIDAREKAGEEVGWQETDKAQRARDNTTRAVIRDAAAMLSAAVECAKTFDESDNVKDLLAGLRTAIRAQAAAFNAEMHARGGKAVAVRV